MGITRSSMTGAAFCQGSVEINPPEYHFLGRLAKLKINTVRKINVPEGFVRAHDLREVGGVVGSAEVK